MKTVFKRFLVILLSATLIFGCSVLTCADDFDPDGIICTQCGCAERLSFICTGEKAPVPALKDASVDSSSCAQSASVGNAIAIEYYCRTYLVCNRCGWYQQVLQFHLCGADGCDLIHCSLEDMQEYCREAEDIGIEDLRHNMYTKDGNARVSRLYETGALPLAEFADWLENKK